MSAETAQQKLKLYENNMKLFVKQVEKQVSNLIEKYEREIKQLKKQNSHLRQKLGEVRNPQESYKFRQTGFSNLSPIKKNHSNFQGSTVLMTPIQFPNVKPAYQSSLSFNESYGQFSKSRFEESKIKQKQRQENLLQSLESGKNNLDLNVSKIMSLFGKHPKEEDIEQEQQEQEENRPKSDVNKSLNTSLNSICESLDHSFHAKKSRAKNAKKRQQQEKIRQKKLQEARKGQQERKKTGIKNLLKNLRHNVNSNDMQPQIIKNTRLVRTGDSQNSPVKINNRSKVMINPVPIDITKRKRENSNISFNSSPKSKSILKSSTSKILTKSMIGNTTTISNYY